VTEAEWLACAEPHALLRHLPNTVNERKLRLFAVACCRRVWPMLVHEESRAAVEFAERYADGAATRDELDAASAAALHLIKAHPGYAGGKWSAWCAAWHASRDGQMIAHATATNAAQSMAKLADLEGIRARERVGQCHLLRCIVGNPYQPVSLDTAWLSGPAPALARAIYDDRTFDQMPILADALIDIGCTDADVLDHCRGPEAHARGCWVLDLLLGRR
jgi:hypothetical protein